MNENWKYILFDMPMVGETPVLFPPWVPHADVANGIRWDVFSAGFVRADDSGGLICYGRSDSLGVESRPEDSYFVAKLLKRD